MDKLDEGFVAREMARFDQRFALCDLTKSDDVIAGRRRYHDSSLDKMFTAWLAAISPSPAIVKEAGEVELLAYLEAEARRFADCYPEASDGRNTFIIFADKIAALSTSNAAQVSK